MRNKRIALVLLTLMVMVLAACDTGAQSTATSVPTAPTDTPAAAQPTNTTAAAQPTDTAAAAQPTDTTAASAPTATVAASGTMTPAAATGRTYILVPKNLGNPYFDTANKGAQDAAKELGVTVTYQGPATADATQQITLINSLIAQHVNGLAISADDSDALVPVGKTAITQKIPVVSWDSAIGTGGRTVHVNQANSEDIGRSEVQLISKLLGGKGKIAILSATATAPNQNEWIKWMKDELAKPANSGLQLVATVYGNDDDTKSYTEAQGLMTTYPDLKGIISPTTVGIAASARAVTDAKKIGQVIVTGLGTPNQMRAYVKSGASPAFELWNPGDLGYLAIYTLDAIASGQITGKAGDTYKAGKLGSYTIATDGTVLLGKPTVFDKTNIDNFNF
jgi:rhamnose transport system substrate-binding protein